MVINQYPQIDEDVYHVRMLQYNLAQQLWLVRKYTYDSSGGAPDSENVTPVLMKEFRYDGDRQAAARLALPKSVAIPKNEARGVSCFRWPSELIAGLRDMDQPSQLYNTKLLAELGNGDPAAAARLLPIVYDELRRLASHYFRRQRSDHTLQPTALVHEAFLRMIDQTRAQWKDRAHFFAVAAKAMRQILVNHAVAKNAEKRGGGRAKVALADELAPAAGNEFDAIALDDALKKLAELDERKARVVELRFFSGLSVEEVAEVLNVSVTTIEGDWRMARAWLSRTMRESNEK